MAGRPSPSSRGFTLVELLIAMGLSLLIVGGMWLALHAQEGAYRSQRAAREERRVLDAAVQQLQRDLQLAGAGLPRWTPCIVPGHGDGNPVLTIRYITDPPFVTALIAPASEKSKVFRIPQDAVRHFQPGDRVLIHGSGTSLAFSVESRSRRGLSPASGSLQSLGNTWGRLSFSPGSKVVRLREGEVQYLLVRGKKGDHRLLRRRGARETVVATGVQDLRIDYLAAPPDGNNSADPVWTSEPPPDTPIIGARVHLAVGQSTAHFTVTPRNLLADSSS